MIELNHHIHWELGSFWVWVVCQIDFCKGWRFMLINYIIQIYNQDFKKSKISRLKAIDKNSRDHHLPVALANMLAYTKFLLPRSMWNNPVSPIYKNAEVWNSCSKTTLLMFVINSWMLYICFLASSISFCFEIFAISRSPDSFSNYSSVTSLCLELLTDGVEYLPFSSILSNAIVLYYLKSTLLFFSCV